MKKRIFGYSALGILSILLIMACIFLYPKIFYCQSFESLTGLKISEYDKIKLSNGDNGKSVEITDKAEIQRILSHFYNIKLRARFFRDKRKGFYFNVGLYKGGELIVSAGNENVTILHGETDHEKWTQYQLKSPIPSDVTHSIYEKYGIDAIYEERAKE